MSLSNMWCGDSIENSRGRTILIVYLGRIHLSLYGLTRKRDTISPVGRTTVATPCMGVTLIATWTLTQGSRDTGLTGHCSRQCAAVANNTLHSTATPELL